MAASDEKERSLNLFGKLPLGDEKRNSSHYKYSCYYRYYKRVSVIVWKEFRADAKDVADFNSCQDFSLFKEVQPEHHE